MGGVVACGGCDCCGEVVGDEKFGEWVVWGELEEIDVDVAVNGDLCLWTCGEDCVNGFLEVLDEVGVASGASVDGDDGVDWIGFVFVRVNLHYDSGCFRDFDVVDESDVEVVLVVCGDFWLVVGGVVGDWEEIWWGVLSELVVSDGDDIWGVVEKL